MFGVKLLTTCLTNISVYMYTSKLIIKKTFKDYNPALEPGPLDPVCHEIHNFNKDTARRMISSQLDIMQWISAYQSTCNPYIFEVCHSNQNVSSDFPSLHTKCVCLWSWIPIKSNSNIILYTVFTTLYQLIIDGDVRYDFSQKSRTTLLYHL